MSGDDAKAVAMDALPPSMEVDAAYVHNRCRMWAPTTIKKALNELASEGKIKRRLIPTHTSGDGLKAVYRRIP